MVGNSIVKAGLVWVAASTMVACIKAEEQHFVDTGVAESGSSEGVSSTPSVAQDLAPGEERFENCSLRVIEPDGFLRLDYSSRGWPKRREVDLGFDGSRDEASVWKDVNEFGIATYFEHIDDNRSSESYRLSVVADEHRVLDEHFYYPNGEVDPDAYYYGDYDDDSGTPYSARYLYRYDGDNLVEADFDDGADGTVDQRWYQQFDEVGRRIGYQWDQDLDGTPEEWATWTYQDDQGESSRLVHSSDRWEVVVDSIYDDLGRPVSLVRTDVDRYGVTTRADTTTFTYDDAFWFETERRYEATTPSLYRSTTAYVWDEAQRLQGYTTEIQRESGTTVEEYVYEWDCPELSETADTRRARPGPIRQGSRTRESSEVGVSPSAVKLGPGRLP